MILNTFQGQVILHEDRVEKIYHDHYINRMSSVGHEIGVMKRFSKHSKHIVDIYTTNDVGYTMERGDFDLGSTKKLNEESLRRIFFTLSIKDVEVQLNQILLDLQTTGIKHRDINPGNLIFFESQGLIKLIDFYWSEMDGEEIEPPENLNIIYFKKDEDSIAYINNQIKSFHKTIRNECNSIRRKFTESVGVGGYKDGSSITPGWSYHPIVIPELSDISAHKNIPCHRELGFIMDSLDFKPTTMLDIGCSVGFFSFNFIKNFNMMKVSGYEADNGVKDYLIGVKNIFQIHEFEPHGTFEGNNIKNSYDIVINLNVHMWLYKQQGASKAFSSTRQLIQNCKVMYFQTVASDGGSMYIIKEYKDEKDIEKMLRRAGAKDVIRLDTASEGHGGRRHLFKVIGQL